MISAPLSATGHTSVPVSLSATPATMTPALSAQADKPNPTARIDLTLGITVLSFHDASGQVIATTPTQQQLNTYLMYGSPGQAAKPAGDGVDAGLSHQRSCLC